jgi:integrase
MKMPSFLKALLLPLRGTGPVITYNGERVKSVNTAWWQGRKRAGFDESVTLYSWRHTLSRFMRTQRVPKREVQGQLGHRTDQTERYAEHALISRPKLPLQ